MAKKRSPVPLPATAAASAHAVAAPAAGAITFVVPGQRRVKLGGESALAADTAAGGRVKDAVTVASRRAGGESVHVTAVPGEDVVRLHLAGGPALVLHPETARDLLRGQSTAQRSATSLHGEVAVPAQLRWRGLEQAAPTRSGGFLGDVLLSRFEVITDLFKDKAVSFVASQVVARIDGQVDAGVYALQRGRLAPLKGSGWKLAQVPAPAQPAREPLLVLIHGTFVDTCSTFGKLWTLHPQRVEQLFDHYGGRVYALDHPTVGQSPIANALTLVEKLPQGARLHLLTHSRGGLVAEVLARVAGQGRVGAEDLAFFKDGSPDSPLNYAAQRKELQLLAKAMQAKCIKVDRVVRVACPARGTLLASQRLDAYLSVLKWTIELAGVPVVPALVEFLTEVARRRARPAELPGLASMIPDTPLVTWLNSAKEALPGELRVVAGDLQGDSIGSWLKTLLADAYYWADNDIVVQTRSMYGGGARLGGASFVLDQTGQSTHFNYFANERSVQAVVYGLIHSQPEGYRTIGPLSWAGQDASGLRGAASWVSRRAGDGPQAADKPAVLVIPGILGSHLKAGRHRIWLSPRLVGGLHKLEYKPAGGDGVTPDGPIGLVYDDLIDHLSGTHEVLPFAFDWRRPIEEEAERLADTVDAALNVRHSNGLPVRILAHSMGGVLARAMQLRRPQTFERLMKREGARLVMLGTPNGGSWAPMQVLSGDDTFGHALAGFGSPWSDRKARQLMAEMPGFLQLQAGLLDPTLGLDRHETWAELARRDLETVREANWWHRTFDQGESDGRAADAACAWGVPPQQVLDQARALRVALDAQIQHDGGGTLGAYASKILLVVGQARFTPDGFEWGPQGFVYRNVEGGGDGRVPLHSALLPGVRAWKLDSEHGLMPDESKAFDAYLELLTQGDTQRLAPLEGSAQRGASAAGKNVAHVRSRPSRARPSGLPAATERHVFVAPGLPEAAGDRHTTAPLRVTVLNGNLSFVRGTLMVGHSHALQLTGTEKVINGLLGGALKDSLDAGLYPDATGSHQVYLNTNPDPANPWRAPRPASVLVVGLGEEGKLTERALTHTVRQGVMAWVQREAEGTLHNITADTQAAAAQGLELSATLLGSGGAGISASTAARAVAQGVREASLRLSSVAGTAWPPVTHLTLVELYLERASDAWQGLQVLQTSAPEQFAVAPTIQTGVGPLRRQLDSGYRGTDYDFIAATSSASDTIAFRLDTKRARTEVTAKSTQGKLLRALVKRASTESNRDPMLGRTLFQLLVPLEVEPFLAGTSRMLLELDDKTAAIPWELLDTRGNDRAHSDEEPWAIRTRLLRKLQQEHYRQQVQDAQADDAVLIIGEPLVDTTKYVELPGAKAEAEAVRDAFTGAGGLSADRVVALIDNNDATSIINALFDRRYRIVHVAGHGEPLVRDPAGKIIEVGGVVLSEGVFLGPHEIRDMRTVPELVFVNCCHLAARDAAQTLSAASGPKHFDRAEFAVGVADALIGIGVRCVVAAGWAVDDQPAKVFADVFYREILGRRPFIDAVAMARKAAWNADRNSNTWAAYQAYGDPDWVYRRGPHDAVTVSRNPADEFESVASPLGLALALEEQAVRAKWMHEDRKAQLAKVRHLEGRFAALWAGMGAVAEAFAVAYSEGGDRDAAIGWYEKALQANDGSASLRAQEQLGNLLARRGWDRARGVQPSDRNRAPYNQAAAAPAAQRAEALQSARADIVRALRSLQTLTGLHPTAERLLLCGSAWKRLAMLETRAGDNPSALAALDKGLENYAAAQALVTDDARAYHPALNGLALEFARHGAQAGWPGFSAAQVQAVRSSLQRAAEASPAFDNQVGLLELDMMEAAAHRTLAATEPRLAEALRKLRLRAPGPGGWQSCADRAELVLGAYSAHADAAERPAALALLAVFEALAGAS